MYAKSNSNSSIREGGSGSGRQMGVIKKDGRVSGFVPSKEAFAVNYPGYPSSISRAVETLGGLEAIHKVLLLL